MEDLIDKNPHSKEELMDVSGFGKIKVEQYGDFILKILQNSWVTKENVVLLIRYRLKEKNIEEIGYEKKGIFGVGQGYCYSASNI